MDRGSGLGEIFRPSESRCAYGTGGTQGERPRGVEADPALSGSGNDGRWDSDCTERRDAAGQSSFPLLSNILLDDLDRELERRGHSFCRYADDCNIYVKSERAGQRVRQSITAFLEQRLKLKVNAAKSAVARPWERKFLGYSMTWHRKPKLKITSQSRERLREKIRLALRRGRGQSMQQVIKGLNPVLRGWMAYFRLTEVKNVLEELDGWLRHKLRTLLWRQWKRVYTRTRNLMKAGIDKVRAWKSATNGKGPWWNGGASHMNQAYPKHWFDRMGLVSLLDTQRRFQSVS
jgi:RNA-directed DNA polymerase